MEDIKQEVITDSMCVRRIRSGPKGKVFDMQDAVLAVQYGMADGRTCR